LKHLLATAVPDYLDASPIAKLPRLRITSTEAHVLTVAEERRLLKALEHRPADRALVIAPLDTLMRLGDLLWLKWAQDHGTFWTVLNPKTGKPYQVPVSRRLREALKGVPRRGEYIFWHRRQAEHERDWRRAVGHMLERAGKAARPRIRIGRGREGLTFHALRHTGTTRMVAAGVDLRTIQELGGWSSLRQLVRYAHPTTAAKRAAVEAVGRGVPLVYPDAAKTGEKRRNPPKASTTAVHAKRPVSRRKPAVSAA
jgi:integrase